MLTLSLIVKNEEELLPVCLKTVKDWVDRIIIVDTGSTDNTIEIAKSFGAQVEYFQWVNDFSKARNYGLGFVKTPWCLWLDADDMVLNPEILPDLMEQCHKRKDNAVWSIYKQDAASYQRRLHLFKTKDFRFEGVVHESLQPKNKFRCSHFLSNLTVLHRKPVERCGEAAQKYLEIMLEKDSENWLGLAESYKFIKDYPHAEEYYWRALNHPDINDTTKYLCFYNVAKLNLEMAREDARRLNLSYKQALLGVDLYPDRAECLVVLGQAMEAMGELGKAEGCYKAAMTMDPPLDDIGLVYYEYYDVIPQQLLKGLERIGNGQKVDTL